MENYCRFSQLKYWLLYICWLAITAFYFTSNTNRILIYFSYSNNLTKASFIFFSILLSGLYYIHSILNYINVYNEVKIRIGKKYNKFIIIKVLYAFAFACSTSCIVIYFVLHDIPYTIFNFFFILFQLISFIIIVFVLKKERFSYSMILYFIINLAFRMITKNWLIVL